jgi:hypothetical protein
MQTKCLLFIFILYLCTQNLKQIENGKQKKTFFELHRSDASLHGNSPNRTLLATSEQGGEGRQPLVVDGFGR